MSLTLTLYQMKFHQVIMKMVGAKMTAAQQSQYLGYVLRSLKMLTQHEQKRFTTMKIVVGDLTLKSYFGVVIVVCIEKNVFAKLCVQQDKCHRCHPQSMRLPLPVRHV